MVPHFACHVAKRLHVYELRTYYSSTNLPFSDLQYSTGSTNLPFSGYCLPPGKKLITHFPTQPSLSLLLLQVRMVAAPCETTAQGSLGAALIYDLRMQ